MWVLVTIYHRLLGRIADRRMEVFRERIGLSTGEKLTILARGAMMAAWNRVLGLNASERNVVVVGGRSQPVWLQR